jgi:DNA repair exonuclease SbcCD ATPase subunit
MSTEEEQQSEINDQNKTNEENPPSETESNSTNTNETNNSTETTNTKEENSKIDYTKLDKNELVQNNPFVKDLLVKFEVLKKGIVDERKKTSICVAKIKKLEEELVSKTNEIKKITQEKSESPKNFGVQNNENDKKLELALSSAKEDIRKLNEQIISLKLEQENNNNKMKKTTEETEDLKKEYQTQIKLLSQANDSLLKEIKTAKQEKTNLEKEIEKLNNEIKTQALTPPPEMVREREMLIIEKDKLISEKEHFEALLNDNKKGKEEALQQLEECIKKNEQLMNENNTLKENNKSLEENVKTLETNSGKMALKLAEYKNGVLTMNLRNQVFHVKRAGLIAHNEIDIIFYRENFGNFYMRIDEKNNSDIINILDVESVNQNDKKKNKVDISYMYKSKKFNISVLVNELVVDQFIDAYKNFYSESMKSQNKIGL